MLKGIPVPDFNPLPTDPCFCGSNKSFGDCCGTKDKRRPPPFGVKRIPSFLPPAKCRKWVRYLESQPRMPARVFDKNNSSPGNPVYTEDPARVCHNIEPGTLLKAINQTITRAYNVMTRDTPNEIAWFEQPTILRYSAGGYYIHHSDSVMWDAVKKRYLKVEDRDLSLLLYINDEYEGGGLTFTRLNCSVRPRVGDVLMFPSGLEYEHRANKVTSGVRYAIACWSAFKGSPRIRPEPPIDAIYPKTSK